MASPPAVNGAGGTLPSGAHRPHGAPPEDATPPGRSLVLAGGGMRVAWQSGVVRALLEEGLTFDHADGTSGGIFTLGMLLSGLSPAEMCERWRTLDVKDFASLMPLREYLGGPTNLTALGDAEGIVDRVHPHLGIDPERIRAARGMQGTFNVCDFGDKTCVPIPHTDVDTELLVAGVSLPTLLPPVHHRGRTWTDAVWIKDANLTEAVRRGARELWLVWCIGNTDRFGEGPLEQYVNTIEMSAVGALNLEQEWIADRNRRRAETGDDPVRLHVVKPTYPLPLDPDFYLGRISADTLVAMGYRDAHRYLATRPAGGVTLGPDATRMVDPPLGARWTEHLEGVLTDREEAVEVALDVAVEVDDLAGFRADPSAPVGIVGALDHPGWGRTLIAGGSFAVVHAGRDTTELRYEGRLRVEGRWVALTGVKRLRDDPGLDLWSDVTTLSTELRELDDGSLVASGVLRSGAGDVRRTVASIEPTGAHDLSDRASVIALIGRTVLRGMWDRYT